MKRPSSVSGSSELVLKQEALSISVQVFDGKGGGGALGQASCSEGVHCLGLTAWAEPWLCLE